MKKTNQNGVTIIALVIMIIIIGILATVGIKRWKYYIKKSRIRNTKYKYVASSGKSKNNSRKK